MSVATIPHYTKIHIFPSICPCNSSNSKGKLPDFHSGQRFLEVQPASAGRSNWGLKWSKVQVRSVLVMRDKGHNRGPLMRGRLLSTEAIQSVQALRRAKGDPLKLEHTFATKIARLLKKDLLSVLTELQRQDHYELALQVFDTVRKEMWYKPNLSLYADMIIMLGRNKLIGKVEALLVEMQQEGLRPDTRICTEIIGSFLQVSMTESAMKTFELMKQTDCHPDKSTFTVLVEGLKELGELELCEAVRAECVEYLGEPLEASEENAQEVVIT